MHTIKFNSIKEMLEWIDGDFDPEEFDLDEVNQRLAG
jgi:hypothetical protein